MDTSHKLIGRTGGIFQFEPEFQLKLPDVYFDIVLDEYPQIIDDEIFLKKVLDSLHVIAPCKLQLGKIITTLNAEKCEIFLKHPKILQLIQNMNKYESNLLFVNPEVNKKLTEYGYERPILDNVFNDFFNIVKSITAK